jgi:Secretion system C-terminal sorting domain
MEESLKVIEIYDVLGEKILTEELYTASGNNTINLTNQCSGVYFYWVLTQNGALIGKGKIIKQ